MHPTQARFVRSAAGWSLSKAQLDRLQPIYLQRIGLYRSMKMALTLLFIVCDMIDRRNIHALR